MCGTSLQSQELSGSHFPFPTFTTYTILIGFVFPPVLKVPSAALVHFSVDLCKLYCMKIWTFIKANNEVTFMFAFSYKKYTYF